MVSVQNIEFSFLYSTIEMNTYSWPRTEHSSAQDTINNVLIILNIIYMSADVNTVSLI
jgi:hypothetical protein